MHYKKLIEAHKLFYGGWEYRAPFYDRYMKSKNWGEWSSALVSISAIEKLFQFIRSWDRFFQGDADKFQKIYRKVFPIIRELQHENIMDVDFSSVELKDNIRRVFDEVAHCTLSDRYESTDASKILHTILPRFFVMWDFEIKKGTMQGRKRGAAYALVFLPRAQQDLEEALITCMEERDLQWKEAAEYIRKKCDDKTLAKLADEYNYMRYTKKHRSLLQDRSILS